MKKAKRTRKLTTVRMEWHLSLMGLSSTGAECCWRSHRRLRRRAYWKVLTMLTRMTKWKEQI